MALSAGVVFVDVLPKMDKFASGISSQTSGLASKLGKLGLVAGAAAAGTAAIKMGLDFENAFVRIGALSTASSADISRWRGEVLQLSGETAEAPNELADALFFLSSAGLKAGDVMPALEASAKAAAVGLGSTADVANIVASAMNAYASSGLTAVNVTDTLVAAVKAGRAEPEAFAGALGRILPVASAAGVGFDEVTASLAALSNIGLDVNEGATAMRGLLQALVAPGTQAAEALADVGISAEQMRQVLSEGGLPAALGLLEERTGGNIDVLRKIIPNVRSLTGELGLTGENAAMVARTFRDVQDSTGELSKAWRATTEGPAFAMKKAINDVMVALTQFGAAVLPVVATALQGVGEAFNLAITPIEFMGAALDDLDKSDNDQVLKDLGIPQATIDSVHDASDGIDQIANRLPFLGDSLRSTKTFTKEFGGAWSDQAVRLQDAGLGVEQINALLGSHLDVLTADRATIGTWSTAIDEASAKLFNHKGEIDLVKVANADLGLSYEDVDAALAQSSVTTTKAIKTYKALGFSSDEARIRAQLFASGSAVAFTKTGHAIENFAGLSGTALEEYRASLRQTLTVSDDVLGRLAEKSKVTAETILRSFTKQVAAQRDYQNNFSQLVKRNIPDKFAQELADMGLDGARIVAALARANDQRFNAIISKWRESQGVAATTTDKITGIGQAVQHLPKGWVIDIKAQTDQAKAAVSNLQTALDHLPNTVTTTVVVKTIRSFADVSNAAGGIIAGAHGFVTRGPRFLVGEGRSPTFAGRGAEAVIPLNHRGIDILSEAVRRGLSDVIPREHVERQRPQHITGDLRLRDLRNGLVSIEGEIEHEDLVRGS